MSAVVDDGLGVGTAGLVGAVANTVAKVDLTAIACNVTRGTAEGWCNGEHVAGGRDESALRVMGR